ncbi:MAG: 4-hydroxyphenylpyruvate dioxygenase, partial [Solirubrobacteraceae bacterium]|nr:4-hydroxyphenylpyruvate dioxygenase [Solirubrobacteraceae bacterium]
MAQQTIPTRATDAGSDHDFMPLNGVDHVELYVGNALQAAFFYTRAFGFREVAYAGL